MTEQGSAYNTRLLKGGALVDEMRVLVRHWTDGDYDKQRDSAISENILCKPTRSRSTDIISRSYGPRFAYGDPPEAWKLIRPLEDRNAYIETLRPIYYWITARNDALLYDFVVNELFARSRGIDKTIRTFEAVEWLDDAAAKQNQNWTPTVKKRLASGLLSTLRDFGLLEGKNKKEISTPYLPAETFSYIAYIMQEMGCVGKALVSHDDWRLFFMSQPLVEHAFLEAHQRGFLNYASAGNVYRIEFEANSPEEMADVVA